MELEKLKIIIAMVLSVDPAEITADTQYQTDLGADSLDLYQIVQGIEEEFQVMITQEQVNGILTVGETLDMIKNL